MKTDHTPGGHRSRGRTLEIAVRLASLVVLVLMASAGSVAPAAGQSPSGEPKPPAAEPPAEKAPAGARVAEEIVAVVGDTPIFRSEVEEQAQVLAEQYQVEPTDTTAYGKLHREILSRLIDDQVLLKEAEAQNLKVTPEEVDAKVEQAIQNNVQQLGGMDAFRAQLEKEGLTEQELRTRYREDARKQLLTGRLIQKDVRPKVSVPADAARKFFEENRSQLPKKPRALHLQDCFIRTEPDTVISRRARERALDVRQKILGGMPFTEAAAKYSDDPRAKEGGTLGHFEKGDLDPDLEKEAFGLKVGEVSQPIQTRFGYHLITLTAKDPDGNAVDVSHILFGVTPTKTDEEAAREKAQKVHDQIAAGQLDLVDAVRQYSDDANSKAKDGDLGWIPIDSFYGDMKSVADTLRVGRLSPPVSGDGGYHIFKVLGEQAESSYTFDEVEDQMKQYAEQQVMEKELRSWLDELRKKYFVEIRKSW